MALCGVTRRASSSYSAETISIFLALLSQEFPGFIAFGDGAPSPAPHKLALRGWLEV